ncbi:hypothetical protein [uncultured Alistipes sp.]|uniref:hypothetical protein n=1 Tax=uncultured Alistipes sp. TaxID=538949 RepID=UPI0032092FEC
MREKRERRGGEERGERGERGRRQEKKLELKILIKRPGRLKMPGDLGDWRYLIEEKR